MILRAIFLGFPVVIFLLGLPLALGWVPPNPLYGFRTPTTFSSLEAWYQINFATGLALVAAGVLSGLVVILLDYCVTVLKPEARYLTGSLITGLLLLASLIPVVLYSNRF